MEAKKRALFIDRDGVINDIVYRGEDFSVAGKKVRHTSPYSFEEFRLKSGVSDVLKKVKEKGYLCILVTNQPDIKYGLLSSHDHEMIMNEVRKLPLDDIYVCYHTRFDNCDCKKPKPGMLLEAAKKWNIDLASSIMLGDTESDSLAGKQAGCRTVILDEDYNKSVSSDYRIPKLEGIVDLIDL
jgi:D-glycero-D-manno-heptose 1,7-bisphosphate phosphatase